jgi:hypothetical protein
MTTKTITLSGRAWNVWTGTDAGNGRVVCGDIDEIAAANASKTARKRRHGRGYVVTFELNENAARFITGALADVYSILRADGDYNEANAILAAIRRIDDAFEW